MVFEGLVEERVVERVAEAPADLRGYLQRLGRGGAEPVLLGGLVSQAAPDRLVRELGDEPFPQWIKGSRGPRADKGDGGALLEQPLEAFIDRLVAGNVQDLREGVCAHATSLKASI